MVLVWRRFLGDLISLADELFFFTLSLIDERLIRWVFTCYSIKSTVQPKKSSSQKHVNADVNEICVNSWRLLIVRKTTQSAIFATRTKKNNRNLLIYIHGCLVMCFRALSIHMIDYIFLPAVNCCFNIWSIHIQVSWMLMRHRQHVHEHKSLELCI